MSTAKDRHQTSSYTSPRDIRRDEHLDDDAADLDAASKPARLALMFGSSLLPDDAVAAWGARAIDRGTDIDLPHDRTSFAGNSGDKARLLAVLHEVDPLATYREMLANNGAPQTGVPITLAVDTGDGFAAAAMRQGGYVYFAAWVR